MINNVLYLGPKGSYSEFATIKFKQFFQENSQLTPLDSISKIIRTLKGSEEGSVCAVIPLENSVEGVVRDTQDNLYMLAQDGYKIFAETHLSIEHSLIGYGLKSEIKTIKSHPQALAQCREYIYSNWEENIELVPTLSTSNAVASITKKNKSCAAIGNKYCAELYNIPIIETGINDKKNNTTRFVMINKKSPLNNKNNKVSIIFSTENKPGALNKVLNVFENHNLNLSYIDSRPSRRELGEYVFYIDFTGHTQDANVEIALLEIQPFVKIFEILSEGAICV